MIRERREIKEEILYVRTMIDDLYDKIDDRRERI